MRFVKKILIYIMKKLIIFLSFIVTCSIFADKIIVDGIERTYILHVPESVSNPAPLVFVLHGGGGSGKHMNKLTGFNKVSDKHGFIVCYPDGIDKHWNDGRKVTQSYVNGVEVNDVKFISLLIDTLESKYNIDSARIYGCGISNGGMMSFRLGCELNNKIAAIAPVAISMSEYLYNSCVPGKPVPLLYIFGNEDPLVPYEGGSIRFSRGKVVSVQNTLGLWVKNNDCNEIPFITTIDNEDDDTYVKMFRFTGAAERNEVVFYLIYGGGHTWPGGRQYLPKLLVGRTSEEFNASEEIWKWFEGKKLE
jgi:polyhydroxybutyrate depolymerase